LKKADHVKTEQIAISTVNGVSGVRCQVSALLPVNKTAGLIKNGAYYFTAEFADER
jgi:hypothetical protein